jgi:hypothetical protein
MLESVFFSRPGAYVFLFELPPSCFARKRVNAIWRIHKCSARFGFRRLLLDTAR